MLESSAVANTSRTGRSTSPATKDRGKISTFELKSRKLRALPRAAVSSRCLEWQVQKLRSAVCSTPLMGWSISSAESAEPKAAEKGRRLEW